MYSFYVTVPAGTADLAAEELAACGIVEAKVERGGVGCDGTLENAYRACLWSRVANRVLLRVAEFPAPTPEALYDGVRTVDWGEHLAVDGTLAVECTSTRSAITHTQYAALKVKDAVVDQFRERTGSRPSVDVAAPDVRVNLHLDRDVASLAIDLSGESLHRRGYRGAQGAAPLKENLAAAVLLRAGWAKLVAANDGELGFVDPMCGAGSLAIEAALIAADVAPGLLRNDFGFLRWRGHDEALWQRLLTEAAERRAAAQSRSRRASSLRSRLRGSSRDARERGAGGFREARSRRAARARRLAGAAGAARPVGRESAVRRAARRRPTRLQAVYALLGDKLRELYVGWQAAVLTGNPPLGRELKIKAKRTHTMYNGPIECRLLRFDVEPKHFEQKRVPGALPAFDTEAARARPGAAMFANRLRKNLASLGDWARKEGIACYRVYDADMPEYAFSIDIYAAAVDPSAPRFVYVQEYAPPATIEPEKARGAPRRGVQRDSRGARRAARARVSAHPPQAERRRAVREARRARRVRSGRRRRPRAARELHPLLGHGLVPRSSADASNFIASSRLARVS